MAKAQLKLLLFLIVLGITLGAMAAAYYIYARILVPDSKTQQEIAQIKKGDMPRIDPGAKRFDAAVELIKENRIEDGRDAMFRLIGQFPDSATCPEAKRIIGEINLDQLFADGTKLGKHDYIVQPGDSLALIATKQGTTMDMLIRLNGLMGTTLQPGDHLTILPLDFSLVVDMSAKTLTLFRNSKDGSKKFFFKEYLASDIRLQAGVKPAADDKDKGFEIKGKAALVDGKGVLVTDNRYAASEKWLPASRPGSSQTSLVVRTVPLPKSATPAPAPAQEPAKATKKGAKSKKAAAQAPDPVDFELDDGPEPGVFLAREDLEELFALVRNGTKVFLVR